MPRGTLSVGARFDAVVESRRWKEALARQTGGHSERIQRGHVPAFFNKARAPATYHTAATLVQTLLKSLL